MSSLNSMGDYHLGDEGSSAPESVSRSGRIRKKNSLLAVYESPDVIEKRRRKSNTTSVKHQDDDSSPQSKSHQKKPHRTKEEKKANNTYVTSFNNDLHNHHTSLAKNIYHTTTEDYGSTIEPYEVPDIAGEEIIDDGGGSELIDAGNIRLKSQAQSTYMLEKSFEKNRKVTGYPTTSSSSASANKTKATRKDKGSPRVTAYMLWAKEQRANFTKKFPHMDFSSLSKKLSDLWATVPQNQKRMWKTKAAKIMRKSATGAENIKNSGASSTSTTSSVLFRKSSASIASSSSLSSSGPLRKGMKNTTPEEINVPKRPPGRPSKKNIELLLLSTPAVEAGMDSRVSNTKSHNNHNSNSKTTPNLSTNKPISSKSTILNNAPSSSSCLLPEILDQYKFKVTKTDPLDVAAHLSLLGESLKKMGQELQQRNEEPDNTSLSVLLDSLLCSVGPLLCLTQKVPELDCIPEIQMKRILNNVGYIMPGI